MAKKWRCFDAGQKMCTLYMLLFKFILGLNFIFLLFFGMIMYDNKFETMKNKI